MEIIDSTTEFRAQNEQHWAEISAVPDEIAAWTVVDDDRLATQAFVRVGTVVIVDTYTDLFGAGMPLVKVDSRPHNHPDAEIAHTCYERLTSVYVAAAQAVAVGGDPVLAAHSLRAEYAAQDAAAQGDNGFMVI